MTQEHLHHHEHNHNAHGHSHHHLHSHNHHGGAEKNISVALFLNAIFVVIEIVGGFLTNSIAILSDAIHDFGDCLSLGVAWLLQKKSMQGRDEQYTYGYKRYSLLGSIFLSGVLSVSSLIVSIEAVKRIIHPQPVHAEGMLWLAIVGVAINGASALRLKKGSSLNERAAYLHIMEDVLGWIGVLVVSIVMHFVDLPVLDPILSVAISIWVVMHVWENLKSTFRILLQATPEDLSVSELKEHIEAIDGVCSIHDLHVWSLDGESHIMTLHAVTDSADHRAVRDAIIEEGKRFGVTHSTIEIETPETQCGHSCD